jgi:hypothetical protein
MRLDWVTSTVLCRRDTVTRDCQRGSQPHAPRPPLMVFKSICGHCPPLLLAISVSAYCVVQDHPAYIPRAATFRGSARNWCAPAGDLRHHELHDEG